MVRQKSKRYRTKVNRVAKSWRDRNHRCADNARDVRRAGWAFRECTVCGFTWAGDR